MALRYVSIPPQNPEDVDLNQKVAHSFCTVSLAMSVTFLSVTYCLHNTENFQQFKVSYLPSFMSPL
jgi:hypothetical protein